MDKDIQHGKYRTHDDHDNARHKAFRASGYRSVVDYLLSIWDTLSLMLSTTKRRRLCKPNILWHLPIKKGVWRIRDGMAPHCFPQLLWVRFAWSQCALWEEWWLFMILTFTGLRPVWMCLAQIVFIVRCGEKMLWCEPGPGVRGEWTEIEGGQGWDTEGPRIPREPWKGSWRYSCLEKEPGGARASPRKGNKGNKDSRRAAGACRAMEAEQKLCLPTKGSEAQEVWKMEQLQAEIWTSEIYNYSVQCSPENKKCEQICLRKASSDA